MMLGASHVDGCCLLLFMAAFDLSLAKRRRTIRSDTILRASTALNVQVVIKFNLEVQPTFQVGQVQHVAC